MECTPVFIFSCLIYMVTFTLNASVLALENQGGELKCRELAKKLFFSLAKCVIGKLCDCVEYLWFSSSRVSQCAAQAGI